MSPWILFAENVAAFLLLLEKMFYAIPQQIIKEPVLRQNLVFTKYDSFFPPI